VAQHRHRLRHGLVDDDYVRFDGLADGPREECGRDTVSAGPDRVVPVVTERLVAVRGAGEAVLRALVRLIRVRQVREDGRGVRTDGNVRSEVPHGVLYCPFSGS